MPILTTDAVTENRQIYNHNDLKTSSQSSQTVYIDGTYFLIQFYQQSTEPVTEDYLYYKLNEYLANLKAEHINFFLDIHYITRLDYNPKYIIKYYPKSQKLSKEEMLESIPFVLKSKIMTNNEINLDKLINYPAGDIICSYEFHTRDFEFRKFKIDDFISVPNISRQLMTENVPTQITDKILALKRAGWNRYLVKRLGKYSKKQARDQYNEEHTHDFNLGKFIGLFPLNFTTKLSKKVLEKVDFFGCAVDAELALAKHLKMYNKHTFPKVITCDTDMLAHLCDIDCNLSLELPDCIYNFSPKEFWKSIFNCYLPANVIRIVCCLLGTDYNYKSKIAIDSVEELLPLLHVEKYDDITIKGLLTWIETKGDELKLGSIHTTILAINIYLSNIESTVLNLKHIPETLF